MPVEAIDRLALILRDVDGMGIQADGVLGTAGGALIRLVDQGPGAPPAAIEESLVEFGRQARGGSVIRKTYEENDT